MFLVIQTILIILVRLSKLIKVPIYNSWTTFDDPTVVVDVKNGDPIDVVAIDHLPTLLPREASESFCYDLLPYLQKLDSWEKNPVWKGAENLFHQKVLESKSD